MIWSCFWHKYEDLVFVVLRSMEYKTAVAREMTKGGALYLSHNAVAFELLIEELLFELEYKTFNWKLQW